MSQCLLINMIYVFREYLKMTPKIRALVPHIASSHTYEAISLSSYASLWIRDDEESKRVLDFLEKNAKSIESPTKGFELGPLIILVFNMDDEELSPFLYDIGLAPPPRLFIGDIEIREADEIIKYLERFNRKS